MQAPIDRVSVGIWVYASHLSSRAIGGPYRSTWKRGASTDAPSHQTALRLHGFLHGIPVTSPERTWADLAALLPVGRVDALVVAGDSVVKRPWTLQGRQEPRTKVQRLREAVQRAGCYKGVRAAREALELIRVGSDAATETMMRLALVHAGLPEPELQLVLDPFQPVSPDADMGYRRWRLVMHDDGARQDEEAHRGVDAWRNKGWRNAGWAQIWARVETTATTSGG